MLIAGISYGTLAVVRLDRTLNKISTDSRLEIVQMAVVVPVSDEAVTVSDVAGYLIGYNESDNASGDMMIELSKNLSKEAEYTGYPNVIFLADSLLNGDEQAIILNSAYVEIISEVEGYEDFSDRVKILDTIPVETVADYDMEDTDIEEKEPYKLSSDEDTFTIYISGIDTYGSVNTRSRSDVNILAVVNTKTGNIQLINTPRDYYVPLPISNGARDKLTHAGIYGVEVSEGTLEILYDVEIDYYVRMNFSSFERIIDTLGGIDVYSEYDFTVGNYHYNVGNNHLSGDAALAFSRERHSFLTGDVQRGKNQMEVIKAIINKMTTKEFLYKYDDVLEELSDCFQTDMPPETMYSLVNYQLDNNISWNVNSYTVTGFDSHDTTYSMPGFIAYVMVPDDKAVEEAKSLIEKALTK
ncbi:MAG: LCP family protein [Lachnospiraceae bacterium]|nr:LCP family protein [Lachnospiraceae bacterium]